MMGLQWEAVANKGQITVGDKDSQHWGEKVALAPGTLVYNGSLFKLDSISFVLTYSSR